MKLTINGQQTNIKTKASTITLEELMKVLNHQPRLVVVEFNGVILPPKKWEHQKVIDGDKLEIVTIVGGGS